MSTVPKVPAVQSSKGFREEEEGEEEIWRQGDPIPIDPSYPGTSLIRLRNAHRRVQKLQAQRALDGEWELVRQRLLWAGGLRHMPRARPGRGYTGHSLNDWNHVDITTMLGDVAHNGNEGKVEGIHYSNNLGDGIKLASLPELGPGGSWSTCQMNCGAMPRPLDVAHVQFKSRVAFKLVWAPPSFSSFVVVDDAGQLLAEGFPSGGAASLPHLLQRRKCYEVVRGSKYGLEAEKQHERVSADLASTD